jgi:hypothetical protein
MKKYRKFFGIAGASAILGFAVYDACKCVNVLRRPLNTQFMNKKAEYIFIPVRISLIFFEQKKNF